MSSNPYARPPKPYNSYAAANSYYSSSAAATTSAAPYPAAASTSAYVAAAAGPVLPAGYAAYPAAVAAAGPVYPGMTAGAGPSDLDAQQASIYTPEAARANKPVTGANGGGSGSKAKGRTTVLRKGGGELWEDQTLLEWDPCEFYPLPSSCCRQTCPILMSWPCAAHFRLFIGDLDPAISDDAFRSAFSGPRFPSFVKSKVVRDKYTNKGKGFGFVAYSDPEDFLKAWKEMNGQSPPPRKHLLAAHSI